MFPLCGWETRSTLYKVLWQIPPSQETFILSLSNCRTFSNNCSLMHWKVLNMVLWKLSWVWTFGWIPFFVFYFNRIFSWDSLLGVERCLFVFVLDSQWKRAPPCHSNSPGAKLLSPDGTSPRHSLLGDDDLIRMMIFYDGNNFKWQKSGIPGRASLTSDFAPSADRGRSKDLIF